MQTMACAVVMSHNETRRAGPRRAWRSVCRAVYLVLWEMTCARYSGLLPLQGRIGTDIGSRRNFRLLPANPGLDPTAEKRLEAEALWRAHRSLNLSNSQKKG
jgi:hypothetical protein